MGFSQATSAQVTAVIPDETSGTTVNYGDTGRPLVDIAAPVTDRISDNTFTDFNVTEEGLDFDNRFVDARKITSEVTGSFRSLIGGDIEILEQGEHLAERVEKGLKYIDQNLLLIEEG